MLVRIKREKGRDEQDFIWLELWNRLFLDYDVFVGLDDNGAHLLRNRW